MDFKNKIAEALTKATSLKIDFFTIIEQPPQPEMGDYALPCFALSKELRKAPNVIAQEIAAKIKQPWLEKVCALGPYVNFFIDKREFVISFLNEIKKQKAKFGSPRNPKPFKKIIEFSQPNTHKAFHVGHIRGTSLGESLARIHEFCGDNVIRANYSGDTGMHIAKWIWCYQKYHSNEKMQSDESWITSIYVDAVKRLAENEEMQKEVQEINIQLDQKTNLNITHLWKKTRKLSIKSWTKIYRQLGTSFEVHYFESMMEEKAKKLAQLLLNTKVAKISEGATIVNLEEYNLGILVILRNDGTALYSAKDLALAYKKFEDFPNLNSSLIIVGNEQDFYFKQLEKTLELLNFAHVKNYTHLPFAMVRLPTGKMSSRTGDNILYSEFINEVQKHAKAGIVQRNPDLSSKEVAKRALNLSIASIKYFMLKQSPSKTIIFKKEDALNFEGDTGPYLLYSYARANSITKKAKSEKGRGSFNSLEKQELELIKKLADFPETIRKAYNELNPSLIANYSYHLSQIFNEFYHTCPVIGSDKQGFRLELIFAFRQVLKKSLDLIGIETLKEM